MTKDEYIDSVKNVKNKRNHKIKNSIGTNDFISAYVKLHKDCDSTLIRQVIKRINQLSAKKIAEGHYLKLPLQMGGFEVREFDTYVRLQDGKVKTNRPIDWDATLKLWYSDEASKKNKVLVRKDSKKVYKVFYNRGKAKYTNKVFFTFVTNRGLKQLIKYNIDEDILKGTYKL